MRVFCESGTPHCGNVIRLLSQGPGEGHGVALPSTGHGTTAAADVSSRSASSGPPEASGDDPGGQGAPGKSASKPEPHTASPAPPTHTYNPAGDPRSVRYPTARPRPRANSIRYRDSLYVLACACAGWNFPDNTTTTVAVRTCRTP